MRLADASFAFGFVVVIAAGLSCSAPTPAGEPAPADRDPERCASCHLAEYVATTHPMHEGAKPTTCGVCHASTSWHPSRLEHPFWSLTGAHEKAACFDCHRGTPPVFHGTSKVCVDCHRADYDGASFPRHSTFPLTCAECHTTSAWKPSTWASTPSTTVTPEAGSAPPPPSPASAQPRKALPVPSPHPTTAPTATQPSPRPTPTAPTPKTDVITQPSRRR